MIRMHDKRNAIRKRSVAGRIHDAADELQHWPKSCDGVMAGVERVASQSLELQLTALSLPLSSGVRTRSPVPITRISCASLAPDSPFASKVTT